jgi:hypothetical protein
MAGCDASAALALKIAERQTILCGLEYAPASEAMPPHEIEQYPRPSATDLIAAAIERLANGGKPPQLEPPHESAGASGGTGKPMELFAVS